MGPQTVTPRPTRLLRHVAPAPQQPPDPRPRPRATTGGATAGPGFGVGNGRASAEYSRTGAPSSAPPPVVGGSSRDGNRRAVANRSSSGCSTVVMLLSVRAGHAGRRTATGPAPVRRRPRPLVLRESDDQLALWQLVHGARAMRSKGSRAATTHRQQHDQDSHDVKRHSPDKLMMPRWLTLVLFTLDNITCILHVVVPLLS